MNLFLLTSKSTLLPIAGLAKKTPARATRPTKYNPLMIIFHFFAWTADQELMLLMGFSSILYSYYLH